MPEKKLSIIVPVFNEAAVLEHNIGWFRALDSNLIELLFVDGGSTDRSPKLLKESNFHVVHSPRGRATQMNLGAKQSTGDYLLFLHVDTLLPENFEKYLASIFSHQWGFFQVALDSNRRRYRWVASGVNFRSRVFRVATGDQSIFVKTSLFRELGGYREIELMEDIELCRRLKKKHSPVIFAGPVVTSARRWQKHGVVKTTITMWLLQLAFKLGVSPRRIAAWYG